MRGICSVDLAGNPCCISSGEQGIPGFLSNPTIKVRALKSATEEEQEGFHMVIRFEGKEEQYPMGPVCMVPVSWSGLTTRVTSAIGGFGSRVNRFL